MYKIICPKCETIQLYPDEYKCNPQWFCSHLSEAIAMPMLQEADINKPLDIQRIQCKVVHIHENN